VKGDDNEGKPPPQRVIVALLEEASWLALIEGLGVSGGRDLPRMRVGGKVSVTSWGRGSGSRVEGGRIETEGRWSLVGLAQERKRLRDLFESAEGKGGEEEGGSALMSR